MDKSGTLEKEQSDYRKLFNALYNTLSQDSSSDSNLGPTTYRLCGSKYPYNAYTVKQMLALTSEQKNVINNSSQFKDYITCRNSTASTFISDYINKSNETSYSDLDPVIEQVQLYSRN